MKIMNLQLHQLSTQCQWKVNQLLFNSQRVGKASLKEKNLRILTLRKQVLPGKLDFLFLCLETRTLTKIFFMSLPSHPCQSQELEMI